MTFSITGSGRGDNRALELIGPSLELAFEVAVRSSETLKTDRAPIDFLQRDKHIDHLFADPAAKLGGLSEMPVVRSHYLAAHVLHQVKRRAEI